MKQLLKFIKHQTRFFINGMIIGASFRLMLRIILGNILLEIFSSNPDYYQSKKKWDWRYWYHTKYSIDPMSIHSFPVDIPEEYVYVIVADILTQLHMTRSLKSFNSIFNIMKVTHSTRCLMETIVESTLDKTKIKYRTNYL